ncbi:MAG TPA: FAD-dependent oxidoreductase [Gemmatimonadaceae bacterium]|jgi:thioredoxin reductase (NADPH)|nr:FAD-dependent oxidoreductase [Gemmatimonadaceae bacterium]
MITADLLTRIPLFAQLPEAERASIAARAADVRVRADEWLTVEGQSPAFFGLLEGRLAVIKSIAGRDHHVATFEPGEYFGEVSLLLGSPTVAGTRALEPARLLRLEPADFHDLVSHCRVLNAQIMSTMENRVHVLKQVVTDSQTVAATVIGTHRHATCLELRDFLARNHVPFAWRDLEDNESLERLVHDGVVPSVGAVSSPECVAIRTSKLPLVLLPDGRRLESPSLRDVATNVGLQTEPKRSSYDVVIVGGGPAGLAAAVYGASEGLATLLVERVACGGQAGTSSRIENYLGFPGGLSGDELSARARQQALRFGAELMVARTVSSVECVVPALGAADPAERPDGTHTVMLDDGECLAVTAVILATGVQYRRLDAPGADRLAGRGVYYGAATTDVMRMRGRRVHLVGGGNSAGQAAMMFANWADSVTLIVRGRSVAASMSQYLIDQLASKANVTIETETQVVEVEGENELEAIHVVTGPSRSRERRESDALFVFIGAHADTAWLPDRVIRDQWGYVCTGRDVMDLLEERDAGTWPLERDPYLLETSVPGVFAAGDVRHGSIKRVASSVGEGSMAIAFVHQYLAEVRERVASRA